MADDATWLEKQRVSWTRGLERVYDEAIQDVDKELTRREEEYQTGLKKRDDLQHILFGRYNEEIFKNARLTEENSGLKHHHERLDPKKSTSPSKDAPGATVPSEEYRQLMENFEELHKKHQEATQRLRFLERKNVAVMQKNKQMKETVLAWQKFSDRHESKQQKLKSEGKSTAEPTKTTKLAEEDARPPIPSSPGSSFMKTPRSLIGMDRSSPAPMSLLSHVEHPPDKPVLPDTTRTDNDVMDTGNRAPRQQAPRSLYSSDELPTLYARGDALADVEMEVVRDTSGLPNERRHSDNKISSSQTTEDEVFAQLPEQSARIIEDDDVPQFVSERALKRKRLIPERFEIHVDRVPSDGTPTNPFRVKEELHSSPPAGIITHPLLRKETLDLDELGPRIISTPHQRQRGKHSTATGTLRHQWSISVPVIKEETLEERDHRIDASVLDVVNDQPNYFHGAASDVRAYSEPFDRVQAAPTPLQPLVQEPHADRRVKHALIVFPSGQNPNVQVEYLQTEDAPRKRLKKSEARRLEAYQMLSEAGDEPPPLNEKKKRLTPETARAKFNRKLKETKDVRTPAKDATKIPAIAVNVAQVPTPPTSVVRDVFTTSSRPGSRKGPPSESRPGSRKGPPSESRPGSRKGPSVESRPASRASAVSPAPPAWPTTRKPGILKQQAQQPIRSKPVSELKLSDFKANPAYNQGYSYAFRETVRKRGERACLPGCTKPDCCGSTFRALAAAAPALSSSQEESLLEEYLGDAYDTMQLTQMSPGERQELILQARTRELANKHGRHKHAYERHQTPPGFWRVDFPTTQEEQEDREKAMQMEKKLVEERRAEAMRKGGRWTFRDE